MNKKIRRLKLIIGQLNWLIKMMEKKDDCWKIIIQFQAAKAALDSAFWEVLSWSVDNCLKEKNPEDLKKILKLIA